MKDDIAEPETINGRSGTVRKCHSVPAFLGEDFHAIDGWMKGL